MNFLEKIKIFNPASSAGKLQPSRGFTLLNPAKREFSRRRNYLTGFTLIELLVVIGIISIVTGIVMSSINNAKAKGRDSKRIADISVIQLALEKYYDEYRHYPIPPLNNDSNLTSRGPIPKDPSTNANYSYNSLNSDNTATCSSSNCQSYHLGATLELSNGVLNDDEDLPSISGDFNGADTAGCGGGTGKCYDVIPKF